MMSTSPMQHSLTSFQDALAILHNRVSPLPATSFPLADSLHCVLSRPVMAPEDIPPFTRSAMDGYAIAETRESSSTFAYRITENTCAGKPAAPPLLPGQCIRIATGAAIPMGATRVIPMELATESTDHQHVTFSSFPDSTHIRHQGEDAPGGSTLLPQGRQLTAGDLSLMASIGMASPFTYSIPKISHLATGDELVAPTDSLQPGQIRDSNSILVRTFLKTHHFELFHQSRLCDDPAALSSWIELQSDKADVLLISGGASVGPRDFPPSLLQKAGFSREFSRVSLRPGKPVFFGTRHPAQGRDTYAFVLPGNPVSHLTILRLLVLPLLQILSHRPSEIPTIPATLSDAIPYQPDNRLTFLPARTTFSRGQFHVSPNPWQSSGDVVSLTNANSLLKIPPSQPIPDTGSTVDCIPLYPHLF